MEYSITILAVIVGLQFVWIYRLSNKVSALKDTSDQMYIRHERFIEWTYKSVNNLSAMGKSVNKVQAIIQAMHERIKLLEPDDELTINQE